MHTIHERCVAELNNSEQGFINYRTGANLAAFKLVASAAIAQGV
jgi:glutamate dehydrogenase/leucine dehydrogenase